MLMKKILPFTLSFLVLGCAHPEPKSDANLTLSADAATWQTDAMSQPGSVQFEIIPEFESYSRLSLYDGDPDQYWKTRLAELAFSGEGCNGGYELVLKYETDDAATLYRRSEILNWGEPIQVNVTWSAGRTLNISAGSFDQSIQINAMPDHIEMATTKGQAQIEHIHFNVNE